MKKLIMLIMAIVLTMPAINADSTVNKELQKALKKEKKEKLKEYKKEGWKLFGSAHTLDVALLSHYDKLATLGNDASEVTGVASKFKSKSVGRQMAINDACITYSQQAGSTLQGRVVSDLAGDGTEAVAEFDHFIAAYERLVEKEIKGEMEESYSIIRENGDGTSEMQVFFIVSESAASKARIRALDNALKESEAAQRHAEKIADFVRAGFNK